MSITDQLRELIRDYESVFAELESGLKSERVRGANERAREEGRPIGRAPYGFKILGKPGAKRLVIDREQRRVGQEIVRVREAHGWSWDTISDYIERTIADHNGLELPQRWEKRKFNKRVCWRMYRGERRLQEEERVVVSADTHVS